MEGNEEKQNFRCWSCEEFTEKGKIHCEECGKKALKEQDLNYE